MGTAESVMCDVIKIRLKGRMRGEKGKENHKKEMDIFYDVTTLSAVPKDVLWIDLN